MSGTIATITDGNVSCGTMLWRYKERLQLTVIVKASFTVAPDGVATHAGPGEVLAADRAFGGHPTRSIELASDLVPYRARCDVTFVGHAYAPGGVPAPTSSVRLGLSREGRPLLDKVIHVFGDRAVGASTPLPFTRMPLVYERALGGPGEPNPFGTQSPNLVDAVDPQRPASFGPVSCFWPARKRLLGKLDRKILGGPITELPDTLAWDYFQAAPVDQQVEPLRGDEWLVLDGVHPRLPRVQTRLPAARGTARIFVMRPGAPLSEHPVELICDTLAIDGDRWTLSLVWRGHHEVLGGEAAISSLRVAAALEAPGAPASWAQLVAQMSSPSTPAKHAASSSSVADTVMLASDQPGVDGTVVLPPEQQAVLAEHQARAPFAVAPARAPAASSNTEATPWGAHALRSIPAAVPVEATLAPGPDAVEGTLALRPEQQAASMQRPIAPFAIERPGGARAPAMLPGAPWSGAPAPAVLPRPVPGEDTLSLEATQIQVPAVMPPVVEPPPMLAPLIQPPPMEAPPPTAAAPTPRPVPPPPAPTPVAPRTLDKAPQAPRTPEKKGAGLPATPEALAEKLRAAGASSDNVAALLRALKPPPPPPDPDEEG